MTALLKHAPTGRVYPFTDALKERSDMIPYSGQLPKPRGSTPRQTIARAAEARAADPAEAAAAQLALARDEYQNVFGKAAHPNMKIETIQARIAEHEAEQLVKGEQVPIPDEEPGEDAPTFGFGEE